MKLILHIVIIIFSFKSLAQSFDSTLFTAKQLQKANTAKNESYLTNSEKEVVLIINLVRLYPQEFLEKTAKPYFEQNKKNSNTASLSRTLKTQKELQVYVPDKVLFEEAKKHATDYGKSGKVGHGNPAQRLKHIQNKYYGLGENCDYGNEEPLRIVMQLLIDNNVPSLGHRKAILSEEYQHIGVSIQPHKKWEWNCVQEFGGKKI